MAHDSSVDSTLSLEAQIETLLFFFAQEVSLKELSKMLDVSTREIKTAITKLTDSYASRGLRIVTNGKNYSLVTAPEMAGVLEKLTEQEKQKPLSKSALETLSIVCYKAPVTRIEIDYVRGVNSNYALRNLLTRGLIEKVQDGSKVQYRPSVEALRFIGVESQQDLPDYETVVEQAKQIIDTETEKEEKEGFESEDQSKSKVTTEDE